jgi:hypothetical protein
MPNSLASYVLKELARVDYFDEIVVSKFVTRGFYAAVAIMESIDVASDLNWRPYCWESLFEGLITDFSELPISGITYGHADSFCHTLGGEVCGIELSRYLIERMMHDEDLANRHSIDLLKCLKRASLDDEILGGRYHASIEFYLRQAVMDDRICNAHIQELPVLLQEFSRRETEGDHLVSDENHNYISWIDFQRAEFHLESDLVGSDSVHSAGFRCVWSKSAYIDALNRFREGLTAIKPEKIS